MRHAETVGVDDDSSVCRGDEHRNRSVFDACEWKRECRLVDDEKAPGRNRRAFREWAVLQVRAGGGDPETRHVERLGGVVEELDPSATVSGSVKLVDPCRRARLEGRQQRTSHEKRRQQREVRAVERDVVPLNREHVRGLDQVRGDGERLEASRLVSDAGQCVVRGVVPRAADARARDLDSIQVSDEGIVVVDFEHQGLLVEDHGLGTREAPTDEHRRVVVLHVVEHRRVVAVSVAEAAGGDRPRPVVEARLSPRGDRRRGRGVSAPVAPRLARADDRSVDERRARREVLGAGRPAGLEAERPALALRRVEEARTQRQRRACAVGRVRPATSIVVAKGRDRHTGRICERDTLAAVVEATDELPGNAREGEARLEGSAVGSDDEVGPAVEKGLGLEPKDDAVREVVAAEVEGCRVEVADLDELEIGLFGRGRMVVDLGDRDAETESEGVSRQQQSEEREGC